MMKSIKHIKNIKLPPDTHIGKEITNGIMVGGIAAFSGVAQIYLRCGGSEKLCHDTIALLPCRRAKFDGNTIIDRISDEVSGNVFSQHGWLVKGYNNDTYTRCPVCKSKIKTN